MFMLSCFHGAQNEYSLCLVLIVTPAKECWMCQQGLHQHLFAHSALAPLGCVDVESGHQASPTSFGPCSGALVQLHVGAGPCTRPGHYTPAASFAALPRPGSCGSQIQAKCNLCSITAEDHERSIQEHENLLIIFTSPGSITMVPQFSKKCP